MNLSPEIIKNEKNNLVLSFSKIDYGIFNALKKQLWSIKETKSAGFRVTHPEVGKIEFLLKTEGKDAKKVWNDAVDAVLKNYSEFGKSVEKIK